MTKPNQKVKDTAIKILEDIGRLTYEHTYKGKHEGRIVEAMLKSVEKHIDSALTKQRKEIKEMVEGMLKQTDDYGRQSALKDILEKL